MTLCYNDNKKAVESWFQINLNMQKKKKKKDKKESQGFRKIVISGKQSLALDKVILKKEKKKFGFHKVLSNPWKLCFKLKIM